MIELEAAEEIVREEVDSRSWSTDHIYGYTSYRPSGRDDIVQVMVKADEKYGVEIPLGRNSDNELSEDEFRHYAKVNIDRLEDLLIEKRVFP